MKSFLRRNLKRFGIAFFSAGATAAVLYAFWHTSFVFIAMLALIAHEMGHALTAYFNGADVGYMFFIPLILFAIGATQIRDIPPKARAAVAYAGPLAGAAFSLIAMLIAYMLGQPVLGALLIIFLYEISGLFIGTDARKARAA